MGNEAGLATAMRARGDAEPALKSRPFPRAGERALGEARGGTGAREVVVWPISASQAEPAVAARVRAGLGVHGDAQARQDQWAQGSGGRAPRPGALGGERAAGPPDAAASREAHGGHGAGASMETDVLVLLPVPAGHCALHAGALGANRVQYPVCPGLARAWRGARAGLGGWVVSWGQGRWNRGDPGLGCNSPAQGGGILISASSREGDVSPGASLSRFGRACLSVSLLVCGRVAAGEANRSGLGRL